MESGSKITFNGMDLNEGFGIKLESSSVDRGDYIEHNHIWIEEAGPIDTEVFEKIKSRLKNSDSVATEISNND
ncbi:hypothetical protein [Pedobacter sp. B4-66]|uniref:hypothetical protein n=1 Tax=Pedobacter sp. B4-66 TaxID=2817280 RepID=UPI001BD9C2C3|nr:hypothetical protein [Pedobacter sp. B4-66]